MRSHDPPVPNAIQTTAAVSTARERGQRDRPRREVAARREGRYREGGQRPLVALQQHQAGDEEERGDLQVDREDRRHPRRRVRARGCGHGEEQPADDEDEEGARPIEPVPRLHDDVPAECGDERGHASALPRHADEHVLERRLQRVDRLDAARPKEGHGTPDRPPAHRAQTRVPSRVPSRIGLDPHDPPAVRQAQRPRRVERGDPAVHQKGDAVAQLVGGHHVVSGQEDRRARVSSRRG